MFNGGETSEILSARSDQQRVQSGCKLLRNGVCLAPGAMTRRPGWLYLADAADQNMSRRVRVFPFAFSTTQSRVLEFYNNGIRIWVEDELAEVTGTPYVVTTTYASAQLPYLRIKQSNDVVYIASPYHKPAKLSRTSDTNWVLENIDFIPQTEIPGEVEVENTWSKKTAGKQTHRYVVTAMDATTGEESLPSDEASVISYALNSIDGNYNKIIWGLNDVTPLEFRVYKFDAGVFGYIGSVPGTLLKEDLVTDSWAGPNGDGEYRVDQDREPDRVSVDGVEWDRGTVGSLAADEWDWDDVDERLWLGGDPGVLDVLMSFDLHEFLDDNIGADVQDTPPAGENPFNASGYYPRLVFFWQQRLGWGASFQEPFTIRLSPSAVFESLAASTPPADNDAIEATLATDQANQIQWVEGDRVLLVGTSGNEWAMGKADEPLVPKDVGFFRQGGRGSESIPALATGDSLLMVQRGGDTVRELFYNYTGDKYDAPDASILANHLLYGKQVVSWCYQLNPYSIVWIVLDDGSLIGLTYMREHEVIGWHRHDTAADGFIEDICCVPGVGFDRVFAVIRRTIGGVEKRFIERMDNYFVKSNDLTEAFFVDCGVKYDGVETATLTDIAPHLAGETVRIWADGVEQAPKVVGSTGTVTLDTPASKVALGLQMVTDLKPNRPELNQNGNTTLGRAYKVSSAVARLFKSTGVKMGFGEDALQEVLLHDAADPLPPAFFTGDAKIPLDTGWTREWDVLVRADSPGPMTVTALLYNTEIGEEA